MRKTFKYRLFPTAAQRAALLRALDACRWVYNTTLKVRRDAWDINRETLTRYDTIKMIPVGALNISRAISGLAEAA